MAGSPCPRARSVPGPRGPSGSKPRPLSATSSETWSSRQVRVSAARVAAACSRTLASAPWAMRSSAASTRSGSGPGVAVEPEAHRQPRPLSRSASALSASARVRSGEVGRGQVVDEPAGLGEAAGR